MYPLLKLFEGIMIFIKSSVRRENMFFLLVNNKYTLFVYLSTTKFVFVLIALSIVSVHLEL